MARTQKKTTSEPACYAMVLPGLESITAEELTAELGAEVKKTSAGLVVFRVDPIDRRLLRLRTTEDVFLLAWGTDDLTSRAVDLKLIQHWTAKQVSWNQLLRIHHTIRPKPSGKPSYRLITQMQGRHIYRRADAGKALAKGLVGKLPANWRYAEENASVEIWLTINGKSAVCGLRLSDRTMRHRTYKLEHIPASLRPTMAAAMVRLAKAHQGERILDPMCGGGTILAEQLAVLRSKPEAGTLVFGGDHNLEALRTARANLQAFASDNLVCWDAARLPLPPESIDCIISNPPFGKQLASPEQIGPLYRGLVRELHRVLVPGGRSVLLVAEYPLLKQICSKVGWEVQRTVAVRLLGQKATISVWQKSAETPQ